MSQDGEGRVAFRLKSAEVVVAALFFAIGAVVVYDSVRLGFGWQEVHGPRPGYFPFYIGLFICIASVVNIARALMLSSQQQRQKTLETLLALLVEQARLQPIVFIVEDLHWIDTVTQALLDGLRELSLSGVMGYLGIDPGRQALVVRPLCFDETLSGYLIADGKLHPRRELLLSNGLGRQPHTDVIITGLIAPRACRVSASERIDLHSAGGQILHRRRDLA